MMCLIRSWIICVFCFGLVLYSDALWCYQCGDSSIEGPCVTDTAGMEAEYIRRNASIKDPDKDENKAPYKYLKDCSNTSEICIIERIEEQGQTHAYIYIYVTVTLPEGATRFKIRGLMTLTLFSITQRAYMKGDLVRDWCV
ncbi:uncharacterized protein LOC134692589 [Mytilus trossulus]|uniref:uncharacterized protein LOC134692589 n=1 Tax=Mytilus trossulus TaxID=6551 RepID=UPI0030049DB0